MKKLSLLAIAGLSALAIAAPAGAERVYDPVGAFTDANGNQGYAEVDEAGAVRACNENPNQPAGDDLTGYTWVNPNGEGTTPSYGDAVIGAGDADGETDADPDNGDESNDCP